MGDKEHMECLRSDSVFARTVACDLTAEDFFLVDVGCSGGIDLGWRTFGDRLRAIGFDPNIGECERLNAAEVSERVRYVPAFVDAPEGNPDRTRPHRSPYVTNNPWSRLSVHHTVQLRQAEIAAATEQEKTTLNQWGMVRLADPGHPIVLPTYLRTAGLMAPDFLKIDVDGPDFAILQSCGDLLADPGVLGLGLEVNFVGSDHPGDHTFHNTDRLVRGKGFDLFDLTVRRYSGAALPDRYLLTIPAQTGYGRPLQGDAIYLRDLAAPQNHAMAHELSSDKLTKSAALFSLFGLPDCAAEILLTFRERLAEHLDVDLLLEILATQAQEGTDSRLSYREYMDAFRRSDPLFFPPASKATAENSPTLEAGSPPRGGGLATPQSAATRPLNRWRIWHQQRNGQ
jgi:hypothetical protein